MVNFLLALGAMAIASKWLASAARGLGVPAALMSLLVALL